MSGRCTKRGLALGLAFAAGLGIASCIRIGTFACTQNGECGPEGVCEDDGYCSSPDSACASGRRWSRYSPAALAARCVEDSEAGSSGTTSGTAGLTASSGGGDTGSPDGSTGLGDTVPQTGESGGDTGSGSPCMPDGRDPTPPVLLYDFCEGAGTSAESITDVKLELVFEKGALGDGFAWVADGLLLDGDAMDAHTALRSFEHTFGRLEPCRESGEVTLEVWATPLSESQGGPTGIVTLGPPSGTVDGDLGLFMNPDWSQPGYVVELRTTEGLHRLEWSGTPYLAPNHLVVVHEPGTTTLYLDGEVLLTEPHAGDLSGWNPNYDLVLGNLSSYDVRNWRGTFHMVALYCDALTPAQVLANYEAGHRPPSI